MSVPTLDDLRVADPDGRYPMTRPLTPAEFDRIARERGFVKPFAMFGSEGIAIFRQWAEDNGFVQRPVCECTVAYMVDDTTPTGEQPPDPDCPSCGGTGFGRLVALDGIDTGSLQRMLEAWPNPEVLTLMQRRTYDDHLRSVARQVLAAFDQEARNERISP